MAFDVDGADLAAMRAALDRREISAVELAETYAVRIRELNPVLNAFITTTPDETWAAARAADEQIAAGNVQPLTGIPIAHKDIFCTDGVRTTCGSRMLENFVAPYDATVVHNLKQAGAVSLGKTNMDEFAMGSSNETSYFGAVKNPWDTARVPGGSSGGSAVAVAAGLAAAATGTDTGGSIRQPAAFCGVCGLKPTYGRVSRYGMIAFASSLDQGGPMARSVEDLAVLLAAMEGHDPRDSTSAAHAPTGALEPGRQFNIGVPEEYWNAVGDSAIEQPLIEARRALEAEGHRLTPISLAHTAAAIPTYYVVASAEASTNLSRYDGVRFGHRAKDPVDLDDLYQRSRSEGFGAEVKRRILTGTYTLSVGFYDAYYVKAQRVRRLIRQDFLSAFETVDLILTPVAPGVAFELGAMRDDPIAMYRQDVFTIPTSLAGLPGLSIPCGFVDDLPVALQLIGPHFAERDILSLGAQYQTLTDWHLRRPVVRPQ